MALRSDEGRLSPKVSPPCFPGQQVSPTRAAPAPTCVRRGLHAGGPRARRPDSGPQLLAPALPRPVPRPSGRPRRFTRPRLSEPLPSPPPPPGLISHSGAGTPTPPGRRRHRRVAMETLRPPPPRALTHSHAHTRTHTRRRAATEDWPALGLKGPRDGGGRMEKAGWDGVPGVMTLLAGSKSADN